MKLGTRFRIATWASVGAVALLGAAVSWTVVEVRRSARSEQLAVSLRQHTFERALLRDEYLLLREPRAHTQWTTKNAEVSALLARAEDEFRSEQDRGVIREIRDLLDRSTSLFRETEAAADGGGRERPSARVEELRRRAISRQLLYSYELREKCGLLVASAGARASRAQQRLIWALALALVGVAAVTILNSRLAAGVLQRRLAELGQGAEEVAGGNLAHRIDLRGDDELAELGAAFDRMTARLQRTHAELETSNRELEAFSYAVSHDLRAPLRSVSGFSQAVLEDYPEGARLDATGRRYLQLANDGAREMATLIDDLLALSRVARAEMVRAPVDVSELAAAIASDLRRESPERVVDVTVAPGLVVQGDRVLLRLAVENLLRNAWKFTSRHATARIAVAPVPGEHGFAVTDDGAGFDMRYVEKLFRPFQRLHRASEFPGTGVGLATVSRIVHRHGGHVSARGEIERGATFTITFPGGGGSNA